MKEKNILNTINKWDAYIRKLSNKYRNNVADSDDLYQQACLKIVHAANLWEQGRASFDTYIYLTIKNAIIDEGMRTSYPMPIPSGSADRAKNERFPTQKIHSGIKDDNDPFIDIEIRDLIERYDEFGIGVLYFIEGLTYHEIVSKTGQSMHVVRYIVKKIKKMVERIYA